MTWHDGFWLVMASFAVGLCLWLWVIFVGQMQAGTLRRAVPYDWVYLLGTLALIGLSAWGAFHSWSDPWHLNDKLRLAGAHNWSIAVMLSSAAFLLTAFLPPILASLFRRLNFRHDGSERHASQKGAVRDASSVAGRSEVAPASPAERVGLLGHLRSDELWNQGPRAVGDYAHEVVLRCMLLAEEDPWDSDEPIWDVVNHEVERRFPLPDQREQVAQAIQTRYIERTQED